VTRDEALDLLPLLAGGELDEVTAAAAQRAAEEDPTLMAELESYRALDAALTTAYAPEPTALAVAEPARPQLLAPSVVVRRRCPYCHDAIEAEALVVCAACATPHHAPCFEANEGCSLLGCGSHASIAASGPASVVCSGCSKHTPQGAPFCAWCGAEVEEQAARPRHARAREEAPVDWRRYAAAAALLLASTFGVGGMFGVQQAEVLERSLVTFQDMERQRSERAAERLIETLLALQEAHRARKGTYARSLDELRRLTRPWGAPRAPKVDPAVALVQRMESSWAETRRHHELSLLVATLPGDGTVNPQNYRVILRARSPEDSSFVSGGGRSIGEELQTLRGSFEVDPSTLEVRAPEGTVTRKVALAVPDWRTTW
jgi:hypothetical protein